MADLSQLEKMAKELKCPICLSLLKSAVSLSCNHVFCNSCILETSKSASDCPVCKVPFRRREVRPSPHMDNLASIFKSMEASAGVNILTTQVATTLKHAVGETKEIAPANSASKTTLSACKRKLKAVKRSKYNGTKDNADDSDSHPVPCFPTKKRIHVTPFPVNETPVRPERMEAKSVKDKERTIAASGCENLSLSPFFWLREKEGNSDDDLENPISQKEADTSPPNFPNFSDLKDSDDESPAKLTPHSKAHLEMDSEMFEWTQRACSPELCATPVKIQALVRHKEEGLRKSGDNDSDNMGSLKCDPSCGIAGSDNATKRRGLAKLGTKKRSARKKKHLKTSDQQISLSAEMSPEISPTYRSSCHDDGKRNVKKANSPGIKNMKRTIEEFSNNRKNEIPNLSYWPSHEQNEDMCITVPFNCKINKCKRTQVAKSNQLKKRSKTEKDDVSEELLNEYEESCAELPISSEQNLGKSDVHVCNEIQKSNGGSAKEKGARRIRTEVSLEGDKDVSMKIFKSVHQTAIFDYHQETSLVAAKESAKSSCCDTISGVKTFKEYGGTTSAVTTIGSAKNSDPLSASEVNILKKCTKAPQICCAFCDSSKTTEISGEMMHYFKGKPVAVDYNGGANLIHVHAHCLEWAPDVYFEDNNAINLVAELARSKRIKCSCCGVKGAALGCFEKSCRKSFHFTCAKMVKECRWDEENFVMLCPLHSSSSLPHEIPKPQRQRKRLKRKKQCPQLQASLSKLGVKFLDGTQEHLANGLSVAQLSLYQRRICLQEIINEFNKLTGACFSKRWTPAVTHIIASTDENGACRRTLKILMGITEGQWILKIDWIRECLMAMEPVGEEKHEIAVDVHGVSGGPKLGRLRVKNKQPKLFSGYQFYFVGDFVTSYKGYLQVLVTAAGGTVLHRKPMSRDHRLLDGSSSTTFIIYNLELPEKKANDILKHRQVEAESLAEACCARTATNSWILNSIAACQLQPLP